MEVRNAAFNRSGALEFEVNHPTFGWMPTAQSEGPLYEAALALNPLPYETSPEDVAAEVERLRRAIDTHVENTAKAKMYNSAAHCASYVTSTVEQWAAEAQAFVAWRDSVWTYTLSLLNTLTTLEAVPDETALITSLPPMQWPSP